MVRYELGALVKINALRTSSTDGFTLAQAAPDGCIIVYEIIDLETYPSHNDFRGAQIVCQPNQAATVMSFLGRPMKINITDKFQEYDVYEVLINKSICHMFAANLLSLHADPKTTESDQG